MSQIVPLPDLKAFNAPFNLVEHASHDAVDSRRADWRLSSAYLAFITDRFNVYLSSPSSQLRCFHAVKKWVRHGLAVILPLVCIGICTHYLLYDALITCVLRMGSEIFSGMLGLQLLGDMTNVAALIAACELSILIEAAFNTFFLLSMVFCSDMGVIDIAVVHSGVRAFYFITMVFSVGVR